MLITKKRASKIKPGDCLVNPLQDCMWLIYKVVRINAELTCCYFLEHSVRGIKLGVYQCFDYNKRQRIRCL